MGVVTQFVTSLEKARVPVVARVNGIVTDPTADAVEMAFIDPSQNEPAESDWNAAEWETWGSGGNTRYIAACLVGPGAVELSAGNYHVFVRVTDNPEIPVLECPDRLQIV